MCSNVYPTPLDSILTTSPQPGATIPENPLFIFHQLWNFCDNNSFETRDIWDWQKQVSSNIPNRSVFIIIVHLFIMFWPVVVSLYLGWCQWFHVANHMMPHLIWYLSPSGICSYLKCKTLKWLFFLLSNFCKISPKQNSVGEVSQGKEETICLIAN